MSKKLMYGEGESGCWSDGARGIYQGEAIQNIAYGQFEWPGPIVPCHHKDVSCPCESAEIDHGQVYSDATEEAIEHMNGSASEGFAFGWNDGDFGLYAIEEEEAPRFRCDQCQALMINGVFCHEQGCPNIKARYDVDSATWIRQYVCRECGCKADVDSNCCQEEYL